MKNDHLNDLFSSFGPIAIKKMFGGKGIYAGGLIIAVELSTGELMFKADDLTVVDFVSAGCRQWLYDKNGRAGAMPYWTVPESAFDDADEMAVWAKKALEASHRAFKKPKLAKVKNQTA